MAYTTSKSNLKQTAFNVAATLVSAKANAGIVSDEVEFDNTFKKHADEVFKELSETQDSEPAPAAKSAYTGGGAPTSGGPLDGKEAGEMLLKGGKFDGLSIAAVYALTKEEADAYGYQTSGNKYIEWIAGNDDPKNGYKQRRAVAFLDSIRAGSDA